MNQDINKITEKIIGCTYAVSNTLGSGFLEKVYENALAHELRKAGFTAQPQHMIQVLYDDIIVGDFVADILVKERILVELKSVRSLDKIHMAQCMNYLRATYHNICLLINFNKPRIEIKRIVI